MHVISLIFDMHVISVNVVTLKSQALLLELYSQYGGDISQLEIKRVEQIGDSTIWKPLTPVTQWSIEKK